MALAGNWTLVPLLRDAIGLSQSAGYRAFARVIIIQSLFLHPRGPLVGGTLAQRARPSSGAIRENAPDEAFDPAPITSLEDRSEASGSPHAERARPVLPIS